MFGLAENIKLLTDSIKYLKFELALNEEVLVDFDVRRDMSQGDSLSPLLFLSLHKKWSFPLRISSVNVSKSVVYWMYDFMYDSHKVDIKKG